MTLEVQDAAGSVVNAAYTANFGVDFVMQSVAEISGCLEVVGTDLVIASDETADRYTEPDPVRLYAATWRLFMGQLDVATGTTLLVHIDTSVNEDVFVPIADCWK